MEVICGDLARRMPVLIGCLNEYLDKWALKTKNAAKKRMAC